MLKFFSFLFFIFFNIPKSKEDIVIRPINIFNPFSLFEDSNGQQGSEPTIVSKKTYTVNGPGGPIRVTQVHISKGKNLGGDSNRPTPISMLSDLDSFFNDFFEQMILGTRVVQAVDEMNRKQNQMINENSENKENNKNKEKSENKENNNEKKENNGKYNNMNFELDDENDEKKSDDKKEYKKNDNKNGNVEINRDKMKNNNKNDSIKRINKKIKGLTRKITKKEIIFSRICKYIFYSIILFTVYLIGKKFLAFLEVLDPDNGNLFGGKIKRTEKPTEEERITLKEKTKIQDFKNTDNKQQ